MWQALPMDTQARPPPQLRGGYWGGQDTANSKAGQGEALAWGPGDQVPCAGGSIYPSPPSH